MRRIEAPVKKVNGPQLHAELVAAGVPMRSSVRMPGDDIYVDDLGVVVLVDLPPADASRDVQVRNLVASHVAPTDAQILQALEDAKPNRKTLREQAAAADADNTAYLAIPSPNNAQVVAQVRKLTQQNQRIIKRLVEID